MSRRVLEPLCSLMRPLSTTQEIQAMRLLPVNGCADGQAIKQEKARPLQQAGLGVRLASMAVFVLFFLIAFVTLCLFSPLWLAARFSVRASCLAHGISSRLMHSFLRANPGWTCNFHGLHNIASQQAFVLVANHQSVADILVLAALPLSFKWVAKGSIFAMPIISAFMRMNGYICLGSADVQGTRKWLRDCERWLQRGYSVLIFPEGSRSEDGELQAFKTGAFHLAQHCAVPVVPIVVNGTREILAKKGRVLRFCGAIEVRILPPVAAKPDELTARELCASVRAQMTKVLKEMRAR